MISKLFTYSTKFNPILLTLERHGICWCTAESNTHYLFPQKAQQIQETQLENDLNYKTKFLPYSHHITIECTVLPVVNKSLYAILINICTSRDNLPVATAKKYCPPPNFITKIIWLVWLILRKRILKYSLFTKVGSLPIFE